MMHTHIHAHKYTQSTHMMHTHIHARKYAQSRSLRQQLDKAIDQRDALAMANKVYLSMPYVII